MQLPGAATIEEGRKLQKANFCFSFQADSPFGQNIKANLLLVIAFIVILLLTSCNNRDKNRNGNIIEPVSVIDVSSFVDSVSYVKLEMTDDCIINGVSKIIYADSFYLITDNSVRDNSIFIFDHSGAFINKISRSGRGPGEYNTLANLDFCEQNQNIFVYDITSCNILEYTITGEYVSTISTGGMVGYDFKVINPDLFLLYSPDVTNYIDETKVLNGLLLIDRVKGYIGNIQSLPESTEIIGAFNSGWFTEYGGKSSLISAINREIYTLNDTVLSLTWNFSFPEELFNDVLPTDKPIYKAYPIESERFIFYYLLFEKGSQVYPVLFDKKTESGVISDSLFNKHFTSPVLLFCGSTEDTFFSGINPVHLNDQERPDISARLGNEINPGDNPIIAIYHLKRLTN